MVLYSFMYLNASTGYSIGSTRFLSLSLISKAWIYLIFGSNISPKYQMPSGVLLDKLKGENIVKDNSRGTVN